MKAIHCRELMHVKKEINHPSGIFFTQTGLILFVKSNETPGFALKMLLVLVFLNVPFHIQG